MTRLRSTAAMASCTTPDYLPIGARTKLRGLDNVRSTRPAAVGGRRRSGNPKLFSICGVRTSDSPESPRALAACFGECSEPHASSK